jgi:hypothetical protein
MPGKVESNSSTLRLLNLWAREVIIRFRQEQNAKQVCPSADEPSSESEAAELHHPRHECEQNQDN